MINKEKKKFAALSFHFSFDLNENKIDDKIYCRFQKSVTVVKSFYIFIGPQILHNDAYIVNTINLATIRHQQIL